MKRYWQVLIILTLVFLAAVQPFSYSQSTPSQSVTTPNIKEDKENKGNKGISEWQGIIGAFLGFLAAFLAEPVKSNASNKLKIKQLRKSLYCEIVSIYDRTVYFISKKEENKNLQDFLLITGERKFKTYSSILKWFILSDTQCFDRAKLEGGIFLYQLEEAIDINIFYTEIQFYLDLGEEGQIKHPSHVALRIAKILKLNIELMFLKGEFKPELIEKNVKGLFAEKDSDLQRVIKYLKNRDEKEKQTFRNDKTEELKSLFKELNDFLR